MPKVYKEPTTLEEAKDILAEIKADLLALESKLAKTESEKNLKTQEWEQLSKNFDAELRKAKAKLGTSRSTTPDPHYRSDWINPDDELKIKVEATKLGMKTSTEVQQLIADALAHHQPADINALQTEISSLSSQKKTLETKIKDLQAKQSESKEETVKPDFDWTTPTVYLGGFLVVLLTWSWIRSKLGGK